ncbi:MAG: pre-mRNA-splicing factor cwc22 [Sclerophora amabilis]|nr:MAG: pre-mRNA-splicing factor cwc22 [Sclerophora amabilis]
MEDPVIIQSAVRLPTPPPPDAQPPSYAGKRKRPPPSRSPSPPRHRSPPRGPSRSGPVLPDVDPQRAMERERQLAQRLRHQDVETVGKPKEPTEEEKQAAAKAEYEKLLNMRSGGTYIPPARLRALQAQITDKTSKEYQRMAWEALKKSINGLINKVNVSNIKHIVPELFGENLVRGRGLFCRSIMKAQAASLPFTPIYATMAAIVNTKLPQVGELLLNRLILQFRKAFKRNDKAVCLSSTMFIAHLCNQQVAHEMIAAEILLLLLQKKNCTDDSVEIAVGLTREVGQHLEEMNTTIATIVFDQFRSILHEADIDKRVQYMIEVLFQVRKDRYKDNPAIMEELDLVEEEDQITHRTGLTDEIDVQDGLNIFKFDSEWEEHEEAYRRLKAEILGEADGSDEDDEYDSDDSSDDEDAKEERNLEIHDQSNTDLVNLRRTIYLTIMSSIDFEECCHKLMKVTLPPGQESELPSMVIECCSQERTYSKFYGLIGERFAKLNRLWTDLFESSFAKYYDTIHRYETNKLRNIARFFGHILSADAIGWHVLSVVHLNEEETTSSSRIFIKILFQDLSEALGMTKLQERMKDELLQQSFSGLFPKENPRNTRFSINYFTSIGMGAVTEDMREYLKNLPKPVIPALPAAGVESDSDTGSSVSSYSSYTDRVLLLVHEERIAVEATPDPYLAHLHDAQDATEATPRCPARRGPDHKDAVAAPHPPKLSVMAEGEEVQDATEVILRCPARQRPGQEVVDVVGAHRPPNRYAKTENEEVQADAAEAGQRHQLHRHHLTGDQEARGGTLRSQLPLHLHLDVGQPMGETCRRADTPLRLRRDESTPHHPCHDVDDVVQATPKPGRRATWKGLQM